MINAQLLETYQFLKTYLEIETDDDNKNEDAVHNLFKQRAELDNFIYTKIRLTEKHNVSIITYQGTDTKQPALLLNHHLDTVPVNDCKSALPSDIPHLDYPLVYRGTQDMKGVGVAHYFALKAFKELKILPKRTIHLCIVPDEEKGGAQGTNLLIKTAEFKKLNIGFAVDEGIASGSEKFLLIKTNERRPVQIKISVNGQGGHGSRLLGHNPFHTLTIILKKIVKLHALEQKKAEFEEPGMCNSFNITSIGFSPPLKNSETFNVIPDHAYALVDIRRSPKTSLNEIQTLMSDIIKEFPDATSSICAFAPDRKYPQPDSYQLYESMEKALIYQGFSAKNFSFEGTTDLRFYEDSGIAGIGITPFCCKATLHQSNESIRLIDLCNGIEIMKNFIINFCTSF